MMQGLTKRITFKSSKINGDKDVDRLESGLSGLEGVRDVDVNITAHTVEAVFDPTVISTTALQTEVEQLGYKIESQTEQDTLPL
jgi:copper chaperone CopZ